MDSDAVRDMLQRYWRAMSAGDFETVAGMVRDDVVVEWPQSGERVRGKEACLNIFRSYPGGSPRFGELSRIMGTGDLWVAEANVTYPDGKSYVVAAVLRIAEGKIAHEVDYFAERLPAPAWRMQWVERA